MTSTVFQRDTCRLCGSDKLDLALHLEPTPLGDMFVPAALRDVPQPCFPLDLLLCAQCANVQLHDIVNPEVIYPEYTYTSAVSLELPEHFRAYADAVIERLRLKPGNMVMEIGSNEGVLLRAFAARGMKVLGVDPAREIGRRANAAGIKTLTAYFTSALAKKIREEHGAPSVIIANNVLANIDHLDDVIDGVRALLSPDGVFIFETSYCLDVVQKALLDTIFHEHISYLAAAPLAPYFARHGMEMIDAVRVATKGGSLRCTVQLAGGPRKVEQGVAELIQLEWLTGLNRVAAYRELGTGLERIKSGLLSHMRDWKAQGKSIAAYGAAVGLTTMLYHFGLGLFVDFIADDNPAKQNLFSPGLHLPVLPSASLYDRKPDYVVVLAWRYIDAIVAKNRAYLAAGGQFLVPFPEVLVITAP
jgi:2-polyprenyl-3-methyl-5-hydroxy-6-metoxy-1,4-benzoquinol methylase